MTEDSIPRRCRIDQMTPAELAIRNAMLAVEDVGADPRLTAAVTLLGEARDYVAEYVDSVPREFVTRYEVLFALKQARKVLLSSGFVPKGDHGCGDDEINDIDAILARAGEAP